MIGHWLHVPLSQGVNCAAVYNNNNMLPATGKREISFSYGIYIFFNLSLNSIERLYNRYAGLQIYKVLH